MLNKSNIANILSVTHHKKVAGVINYAILKTVVKLVGCKDFDTEEHLIRCYQYLEILLREMKKHREYRLFVKSLNVESFLMASMLHDIGKISISDIVLLKPERLTNVEYEEVKRHVEEGVKILENLLLDFPNCDLLQYAKVFAGAHHEHWDGSGYYQGLKGEEIPLPGRMLAIIDVYDALTGDRIYKDPMPHHKAIEIISQGKGTHFDPNLTDLFLKKAHLIKSVRKIPRDAQGHFIFNVSQCA